MKLASPIQGTAIIHFSPDETAPEGGYLIRDLLQIIGDTYQFSVKPEIPPNMLPASIPMFAFQSGVFATEKERLPIVQLLSFQNAVALTANSTEIADKILDDYISVLNTKLRFRFSSTNVKRTYHSNIAVQFDSGIEEKISAIRKIEGILELRLNKPPAPFKIKKLAFGHGDPTPAQMPVFSTDIFEKADFFIERRAGEPYAKNAYFCAGPTRTEELIKIIEEIEQAMSG